MHIGSSDDPKAVEEDVPALMLSKTIKIKELVKRYGDTNSNKVFSLDDYKTTI